MFHRNRVGRGFSLVELLIVIVIVGVLGVVSFIAVQRTKMRTLNEKMLDDLVAIANALEDYRRDHQGLFPVPTTQDNQNILCFFSDATYADCDDPSVVFIQGMIDNNLLTKRYLREVPTDPRTGSRYVYGVSYPDAKFYQVAGIYEVDSGSFEARTVENLAKGFQLPSLIRAYDGPNFVIDREANLPYPSDHLLLTGMLDNVQGNVTVDGKPVYSPTVVKEGQIISTLGGGEVDIYFSDGSVTHMDPVSELDLKTLRTDKNDKEGTITRILMNLTKGKIWSKVARLASNSEFRVETTSAIAGVRGTEFSVDSGGDVRIKSGKVWGKKKIDLSVDLNTSDAPADLIFSDIKKPVDDSLDYKDPVFVAQPLEYLPYYETIPLTANNRPHILMIRPSDAAPSSMVTLTIRNVNFFVNQINEKLGSDASKRHVQATRLAFYNASVVNAATDLAKLPQPPPFVVGGIGSQQTDPYTIDLNPATAGSLMMRFEYLDGHDNLLRFSDFASVPPLKLGVTMEQKDIYPNMVALESGPTLDAPDMVALRDLSFNATFGCPAGGKYLLKAKTAPPKLLEVIPPTVCSLSPTSPSSCPPSPATTATVNVPVSNVGGCDVSVEITAADGTITALSKRVQVLQATAKLTLLEPKISSDRKTVTLSYTVGNIEGGGSYAIVLYNKASPGDGNRRTKANASSSEIFTVSAGINYHWDVTVTKNSSILSTAGADFSVPSGPAPTYSFTISKDKVPLSDPIQLEATASGRTSLDLNVTNPDSTKTYSWIDSMGGTITPSNSTTSTLVMANPANPGESVPHTIELTIKNPADRVSPSVKVSRKVTLKRPPEITGITLTAPITKPYQGQSYDLSAMFPVTIAVTSVENAAVPVWSDVCDYKVFDPSGNEMPVLYSTSFTFPSRGMYTVSCVAKASAPAGFAFPLAKPTNSVAIEVEGCGDGLKNGPEECDRTDGLTPCDAGNLALGQHTCNSSCELTGCGPTTYNVRSVSPSQTTTPVVSIRGTYTISSTLGNVILATTEGPSYTLPADQCPSYIATNGTVDGASKVYTAPTSAIGIDAIACVFAASTSLSLDGNTYSFASRLAAPFNVNICGDGIVESGEECDDKNAAGGDGCSATCQIEAGTGWACYPKIFGDSASTSVCDKLLLAEKCVGSGTGASTMNTAMPLPLGINEVRSYTSGRDSYLDLEGLPQFYKNRTLNTYFRRSDQSCWTMGAIAGAGLAQSCAEACASKYMICTDSSSGGTNWNDVNAEACKAINPDFSASGKGGTGFVSAPYYSSNSKRCYYRDSSIALFDDPTTSSVAETLCTTKGSMSSDIYAQRICKCVLQ